MELVINSPEKLKTHLGVNDGPVMVLDGSRRIGGRNAQSVLLAGGTEWIHAARLRN